MKRNIQFLLAGILFLCLACGGSNSDPDPEPEPTPQQKTTALLTGGTGKWNPATLSNWVTVEGVNAVELFKDFTITFTATGYTTTGTTPVWPRSGTWRFKDQSSTVLIRESDNKEVTIESINEITLRITLTWDETTYGGKTTSLGGKHEFNLTK